METFDVLREQVVRTPAGLVELSTASHDDGAVSVVAWLLPAGRRVGYLRCRPRQSVPEAAAFDPILDGTTVRAAMQTLLDEALNCRPSTPPIGQRLVRAGVITDADVSDLLGWQWLLAELGAYRRLGELAAAAGLLAPDVTDALADELSEDCAVEPLAPLT